MCSLHNSETIQGTFMKLGTSLKHGQNICREQESKLVNFVKTWMSRCIKTDRVIDELRSSFFMTGPVLWCTSPHTVFEVEK